MIESTDAAMAPLTTDVEILARVRELIGPATARQLWALLLQAKVQLPILIPIEGIPEHPDADADGMLQAVLELARAAEADEVVLVLERPGRAQPRPSDHAWASAAARVFLGAGVGLRAIAVTTRSGARLLERAEPAAAVRIVAA